MLIVSARLVWDPDSTAGKPFGDGRLTANGTFQKYYHPDELKGWVESTLGRTAITASPGIVYVFREPGAAQQLLARHTTRDQPATPRDRRTSPRPTPRLARPARSLCHGTPQASLPHRPRRRQRHRRRLRIRARRIQHHSPSHRPATLERRRRRHPQEEHPTTSKNTSRTSNH